MSDVTINPPSQIALSDAGKLEEQPAHIRLWRWLEERLGARLAGFALALIAELIIIALLLTIGWNVAGLQDEGPTLVTLEARNIADQPSSAQEDEPEPQESEQTREDTPPDPQPRPVDPDQPQPPVNEPLRVETPPIQLPLPDAPSVPAPPSAPPRKPAAPAAPAQPYGPPDTGPPNSQFDSRRVGTAPNGEPMYAARWYRRPTRQELSGYLSTATPPASALIVCKTVPDFYVEHCELLGETPRNSNIGRAVMAATWQFRVRPAIIGGRSQVGSWVRIRIDYTQSVKR